MKEEDIKELLKTTKIQWKKFYGFATVSNPQETIARIFDEIEIQEYQQKHTKFSLFISKKKGRKIFLEDTIKESLIDYDIPKAKY